MRVRRRRLLMLLPLLFAALLGMHTLAMSQADAHHAGAHPAPHHAAPSDSALHHSALHHSALHDSALHDSAAHSSAPGPAHHRMVLPFAADSAPARGLSTVLPAEAGHSASSGQHTADDGDAAVAVASWCLLALAVLLRLVRPRAHLLPRLAPRPRAACLTWVPTPRPARPPSLILLSISRA
ncbi:hypothetical protein [Zhihengliuella sp.]|uniref:hypothetical protein n=1 Tax=Zhihengliuella sp. TaxID=1954483 RepID=UPI002811096F|nr:hypothetical protein [Zhihengliuella sp.]